MTDHFSDIALGEALVNFLSLDFTAQAAVAKGEFVKMSTHTTGVIGSVTPVTTTGDLAVGMAIYAAAASARVTVCVIGIVKVTASGSITLGAKVKTVTVSGTMTAGYVITAAAAAAGTVGFALQTFSGDDTGLIFINCGAL